MRVLRPRSYYTLLVLVVLATVLAVRYADPFVVRSLRLLAFDTLHRLSPAPFDPNVPVRIVDIDEESLARYGQWPWPRTLLRDLVVNLGSKGAAVVAFDFLFIEPDRSSPKQTGIRIPPHQVALRPPEDSLRSNDRAFADALAENPTVLATALLDKPTSVFPSKKAGFAVAGDDPSPFLVTFPGLSSNLRMLDDAAHGIGAISWIPERDQIVRNLPLIYRVHDQYIPALAAEAIRVAQGASTYLLKSSNASGETALGKATGLNHIRIGNLEIPTDSEGAIFVKFRHFTKAIYLPAWKVLSGAMPDDEISGKIIFVGTSAAGLFDLRATPLDPSVPGVEIHAQMLEQMLKGEFLHRPDYALGLEQFVILAFGIMLALVLPRVSARPALTIGAVTILCVVAASWIAFHYGGLMLDPSYTSLSLGLVTVAVTSYTYQNVEAQRGAIRAAFGRYLAPAVVEELIANPEKLELGGEERELTLMFCDVRSFTSISEGLTPSELTRFINELLSPLSEIILAHRGTIDKYIGDAIMAFWNAPLDDREHAANACRSALQMLRKIDDLNIEWRERASALDRPFQDVKIGFGINTGRCCVGNLGSNIRFDYSAIGDEVNVASRFESLSKVYGVSNVIGQHTLEMVHDLPALELDMVRVKGRTRPTRIYTFLEALRAGSAELGRLSGKHQEFLTAYRRQQWDEAERLLGQCRSIGVPSLETCYETFLSRIAQFRNDALPIDWDGSFVITEK
jgi:adenylate cyclase